MDGAVLIIFREDVVFIMEFFGFLHLLASCFLAEGLATEQLVVAETPMSELLKYDIPIINPRISKREVAGPSISNQNFVGEFTRLLLISI